MVVEKQAKKQAKRQDQGSAALWLRENWRVVLQIIAWILLFISGSAGLGSIGAIQDRVMVIQSQLKAVQEQNDALNMLVASLRRENDLLRERIAFLQECLTNPLPWPGGTLCPKPKE